MHRFHSAVATTAAFALMASSAAALAAPAVVAQVAPAGAAASAATRAPAVAPVATAASTPAAAQRLETVDVVGVRQRLDAARNSLLPETGSTIYRFGKQELQTLPLGESTPLNQVLLQAPGVVQDSYGQLHVRGDHGNVQYRINGVIIPEAISGFGQSLETRFADSLSLLTGALPAQYGYRTAAVVDIHTKGDAVANGGSVGILGGNHGYRESNGELSGSSGALSWFVTGSYQVSDLGIENPTAARDALHDRTQQGKAFAYLSYVIDPTSRASVILGSTDNRFEIPNVPGQTPLYSLGSTTAPDSAALDARQRERNRFVVATYQGALGNDVDYQASLFHRWTDLRYRPDPIGDLVYTGIAADIGRRNVASGVQLDSSWHVDDKHTLRAGVFGQFERYQVGNAATVFPGSDGMQSSTTPLTIEDDSRITGRLFGVYLQDEWQPLKSLTINYGLRYDRVDTVVAESQLSPRLGAVYDLTPELRLHAGYSRYFTPPPTEKIDTTSIAKFAGTSNELPSDADTAVRSERSNYFDIGAAWQPTPRITLGIDGYYRRVRHLQDEGQFGNALVYSAFNFAQGRIAGFELSATYKDKGLTGYANVGFTRARGKGVETGQFNFDADELAYIASHYVHLDHEQRLSASAGVSYRWSGGPTLAADAIYGSGLRNDFANTGHLPGYTQVNTSIEQGVDLGGWLGKLSGRLAMLNVFDRSYELRDGSGIGVGAPQFGPRRTWIVGLSKAF